jgi:hypothetical protein
MILIPQNDLKTLVKINKLNQLTISDINIKRYKDYNEICAPC